MAHLLVIDDDEVTREYLQAMLEYDGHTVVLANNGELGINIIEQESFDLVITDIYMPEKDGIATLADIKRRNASIKVLMISGGSRTTKKDLYLKGAELLGADASLAKPFTISELRKKLDQLGIPV